MSRKYPLVVLFVLALLGSCTVERVVYIEVEADEPVVSRVSANVIRWSVNHNDGIPYITANGMVINRGPMNVRNVRVWIASNHGYVRSSRPTPANLGVEDVGSWSVSNLQGTYIQEKNVTFD